MRFFPALLSLTLAWALSGCDSSPTASHPEKAFTDEQRSSCPANPFGPADPIAPKRAAVAVTYDTHTEIYTSRGKFIRAWDYQIDPNEVPKTAASPSPMYIWDGRDEGGKEVPSGYYFMVAKITLSGTSSSQTQVQCIFWVNSADEGKMK